MSQEEIPNNQEIIRNPDGTFPKGVSGNPAGRPKGQTLKEYWRQRFANMTDQEKEQFTTRVAPDMIWKMAEGKPKQDVDANVEMTKKIISIDE